MDKLKQLAEKIPNRYVKTEDNQWRSPPAEEYPNGLGGRFHLWSDEKINWKLQRNLEFLEDYYRGDKIAVSESVTQLIKALVSAQPSITLSHLIDNTKGIKTNDIYYLIAQKVIYIDLENCLLSPVSRTIKRVREDFFSDSLSCYNYLRVRIFALLSF